MTACLVRLASAQMTAPRHAQLRLNSPGSSPNGCRVCPASAVLSQPPSTAEEPGLIRVLSSHGVCIGLLFRNSGEWAAVCSHLHACWCPTPALRHPPPTPDSPCVYRSTSLELLGAKLDHPLSTRRDSLYIPLQSVPFHLVPLAS